MTEDYDIIWFDEVDSTNVRLTHCKRFHPTGTIFAALSQSAGRGQKGNIWHSARGSNLTFSILFKPHSIPAGSQFAICEAVSLALADYLASKRISCRIKWPNDIYVGDRKICGILIENTLSGEGVASSIIGIGFNLNQTYFPPDVPNATSLSLLTGGIYNLKGELKHLAEHILRRLDAADKGQNLKGEYETLLYRKDKACRYVDCRDARETFLRATTERVEGGREITATLRGVDECGRAEVELENGEVCPFTFKELRYKI